MWPSGTPWLGGESTSAFPGFRRRYSPAVTGLRRSAVSRTPWWFWAAVPLAVGGVTCTAGAESVPVPAAYRANHWTSEQGLPQNTVNALLQTRDGYLWSGTLYGLARFDGRSFHVFDQQNTPAMISDAINALAEDTRDGSLYVATRCGLLRYREHRFERVATLPEKDGVGGRISPAREGAVWVSTQRGTLVRWCDEAAQTWKLGEDDPTNEVCAVFDAEAGAALITLRCGLHRLDLVTGQLARLGPPDFAWCQHAGRADDGALWLATGSGVWRWQGQKWQHFPVPTAGLSAERVCRTTDGELWATLHRLDGVARLYRWEGDRFALFALPGLPEDSSVNTFCEGRERGLWIGTSDGLFQLQRQRVLVYAKEQGLRSENAGVVTAGQDGTIWIGTAAGVSAIRGGTVENLPPADAKAGMSGASVLWVDSTNRLWVSHDLSRLDLYADGRWIPAALPASLAQLGGAKALYEDRTGRVWIGTEHGVFCGENGAWRLYSTTNGLSLGDVRVIHQDRRGDLWFGTFGGGLNRWHDGVISTFATTNGDYNNRAWWIHEDAAGVFWVATQNGLNRFMPPDPQPARNSNLDARGSSHAPTPASGADAGGRFFTFTTAQGLHENVVNHVQEDDFGYLWLSGLRGLYRISRQDLNAVAAGRLGQVRCLTFGEADGMLSSECNGGDNQPAGCKDRQGRLWFPTARGVVVIDPRAIRQNDVPPPVVIERVVADGQVVYGDGVPAPVPAPKTRNAKPDPAASRPEPRTAILRLSPGRARGLEIRYTANSFAAPNRVRFQYRLAGYDRDWQRDDENRRVAFYTNLRPGRYEFEVRAANNQGIWSDRPEKIGFNLAPHAYETWPFYLLCGLSALGTVAGVQAYRLRWQRRLLRLEHGQALANERTRIARDLHDDLGTALTGAALELEVLRRESHGDEPVADQLRHTADGIRAMADRMREVVWAVNPHCDKVSSLASFLEQQAAQFLRADGLRVRLDFPEDIPSLAMKTEARHQLALGVREALVNVVRHARAMQVELVLRLESGAVRVEVRDDGVGFDAGRPAGPGHGLENLRHRLKLVGGRFEVRSTPGQGTVASFRVPLGSDWPGGFLLV